MKKHNKRYMLIFKAIYGVENYNPYIKSKYVEKTSYSEEEFDDIHEVNDIIGEYAELYKDEIAPVFVNKHYVNKNTGVIKSNLRTGWYSGNDDPTEWKCIDEYWDFSDNKKWWAYIVLDFAEERIIRYGGDSQVVFCDNRKTGCYWPDKGIKKINLKTDLRKRDLYFCGDDEIPKNYKWEPGEYEGWLQYRWGNGKNALTYVEPPKKPKKIEVESEEATEEDLKKYLSNYDPTDDTDNNVDVDNDIDNEDDINIEEQYIKEDINKIKNNDPWY